MRFPNDVVADTFYRTFNKVLPITKIAAVNKNPNQEDQNKKRRQPLLRPWANKGTLIDFTA